MQYEAAKLKREINVTGVYFVHYFEYAVSREEVVYEERNNNTDCRVKHTVERVPEIRLGSVLREHYDAENNTARLDSARPAEELTRDDEKHDTDKKERHHKH